MKNTCMHCTGLALDTFASATLSTHWLDCPFLMATQVKMVKRTIARLSRVLFFAADRDQDAPAQVKTKNPDLEAKSVFGFAKLIALRAYAPDRQVFHFQNALTGEIMKVEMPLPRHWVAGSQNTHATSRSIRNKLRLELLPLRHDAVSATEALAKP